jgi:hypothetical protein
MRRSMCNLLPGLALLGMVAVGAAPGLAAGSFDGTYRGPQKTIRSNNSAGCSNLDHDVVIRIVDNHFTRSWGVQANGSDTIQVDVGADGSFKGSTASLSDKRARGGATRAFEISGQIKGGVLQAELGSSLCAVSLTLKKS